MSGITDPTEQYFKDGLWGWDGTRWQKLPMLFGYSAAAGEIILSGALAAGTNYFYGAVIPAGEIWVVTNVIMTYTGTVPFCISAEVIRGGLYYYLYRQMSPASYAWYDRQTNIVMVADDRILFIVIDATLNDTASLRWLGFKVKVT